MQINVAYQIVYVTSREVPQSQTAVMHLAFLEMEQKTPNKNTQATNVPVMVFFRFQYMNKPLLSIRKTAPLARYG